MGNLGQVAGGLSGGINQIAADIRSQKKQEQGQDFRMKMMQEQAALAEAQAETQFARTKQLADRRFKLDKERLQESKDQFQSNLKLKQKDLDSTLLTRARRLGISLDEAAIRRMQAILATKSGPVKLLLSDKGKEVDSLKVRREHIVTLISNLTKQKFGRDGQVDPVIKKQIDALVLEQNTIPQRLTNAANDYYDSFVNLLEIQEGTQIPKKTDFLKLLGLSGVVGEEKGEPKISPGGGVEQTSSELPVVTADAQGNLTVTAGPTATQLAEVKTEVTGEETASQSFRRKRREKVEEAARIKKEAEEKEAKRVRDARLTAEALAKSEREGNPVNEMRKRITTASKDLITGAKTKEVSELLEKTGLSESAKEELVRYKALITDLKAQDVEISPEIQQKVKDATERLQKKIGAIDSPILNEIVNGIDPINNLLIRAPIKALNALDQTVGFFQRVFNPELFTTRKDKAQIKQTKADVKAGRLEKLSLPTKTQTSAQQLTSRATGKTIENLSNTFKNLFGGSDSKADRMVNKIAKGPKGNKLNFEKQIAYTDAIGRLERSTLSDAAKTKKRNQLFQQLLRDLK